MSPVRKNKAHEQDGDDEDNIDIQIKDEPENSGEELDPEVRLKAGENDDDDNDSNPDTESNQNRLKIKKRVKPGIIYLSKIPPKMNVKQIREYFGRFGELNRSFLQPEKKPWKGKGKPKNQTFTEGWIEFKRKKHAKKVAETLNNHPVGGKKAKEYHDFLWNIKYLHGFLWVHLNERLAYERISQQHKVRAEISAAKRESAFFAKNVALNQKLKKNKFLRTQEGKSN